MKTNENNEHKQTGDTIILVQTSSVEVINMYHVDRRN